MARDFQTVGVVGLGTMGAGIAEVFARSGLDVVGVEADEAALARGRGHVQRSTARAVQRGRLTEAAAAAILGRVTFATDLAALSRAELVVEAVPERIELKQELFGRLDAICPDETVLATNTSSLSVTQVAMSTDRPSRVVGMHFFNPAPVMKLVEVVRTVATDPAVADDIEHLAQRLGKTGVTVGDKAGFIANALLFGYLNSAMSLLGAGQASREDIDIAMQVGCGLPLGPFALLDLIGLDTAYQILDTMYQESRDRLLAPAPILGQLVTARFLGRKSGRGFYAYESPGSGKVVDDGSTRQAGATEAEPRPVRRVAVVGSGTSARQLVVSATSAGFDVVAHDGGTSRLDDLADVELVVVAGTDAPDAPGELALLSALDGVVKPGTVLATTSGRPVIDCAVATGRPADVVGMHVPAVSREGGVVEVVSSIATSPDVIATAYDVVHRLGKRAVRSPDTAGFLVDRLVVPYLNDAVRMLEAHYASADDIDAAMTLGCGYPVGPFELLDEVGSGVALDIQWAVYRQFREPGLAPAPLLEHLATAAHLGRPTGRGFRERLPR